GVVADVYQYGLDSEKTMQLYVPHAENAGGSMTLVIRTAAEPAALAPAVRSEVLAIDKDQPVSGVRTMEQILADSMAGRRFSMSLLTLFAGIALALAAIGVYAVLSYSVAERKHEFGIRLALGAPRRAVLWLIVKQGITRALAGAVAGVIAALGVARLLANLLFGVKGHDLATLSLAAIVITAVAFVACYIPARRAARLDPVIALKCD